jgi:hypothetical protein
MQLKQEWIYLKSLSDKFIIVLILIQTKKIRKIPLVFGTGSEAIGENLQRKKWYLSVKKKYLK